MGEAKEVLYYERIRAHGREMFLYYLFSDFLDVEEKTNTRGEWSNFLFLLKIALFGHKLKNPTYSLFRAWSFSWSTFGLHLVGGPKALQIVI